MADLKISQLTGATTPLAGTEVLPIVQSGATKKVSIDNLTAGKTVPAKQVNVTSTDTAEVHLICTGQQEYILGSTGASYGDAGKLITYLIGVGELSQYDTAGNLKLQKGNIIQGTAAKGVNFTANTPAAGMTSQLLNWYEEGTFTPTVIGTTSAGTASYAMQKGVYTRIGNVVYFYIGLNWNSGTGTGNLRMSGLPFTTRNDSIVYNAVTIGGVSDLTLPAGTYLTALTLPNTNTITFLAAVVGPGGTTTAVAYDASAEIECNGFYFI